MSIRLIHRAVPKTASRGLGARLLLPLLLLAGSPGVVPSAFAQGAVPPLEDAVEALARGDLTGAEQRLRARIRRPSARTPGTYLARALLELAKGRHREAHRWNDRILKRLPNAPDALVVRHLIEQRRLLPSRPWRDSLADAWELAGRPELSRSLLPTDVSTIRPIPDAVLESLRGLPAELLVPAGADRPREEVVGLALTLAPGWAPEATKWVAIAALSGNVPEPYGDEATRVRARLIAELAESMPERADLAWARILGRGAPATPLGDDDLSALEAASKLPEYSQPTRLLFRAFGEAYSKIDPSAAHERAYVAMRRSLPLGLYRDLVSRIDATARARPSEKARAAKLLAAIGERVANGRTLLELGVGLGLMERAEKLDVELLLPNTFYARRQSFRALVSAQRAVEPFLSLPLAPLLHEIAEARARDEVTFFERFVAD